MTFLQIDHARHVVVKNVRLIEFVQGGDTFVAVIHFLDGKDIFVSDPSEVELLQDKLLEIENGTPR
jgi:hypothetical protein